ncbi:MAG: hypothetical protein Q8O42_09740 [Acidobacteriota bacterium]|nr:hypothetical protein [Acidobacteriota bacterium]
MGFPTPTVCPKCGDQLSSPILSKRFPGTAVQTCRNDWCLHTARTTIAMVEQPRPRPVSLPIEPVHREAPLRPAAEPPSAIRRFEDAHRRGESRKAIGQVRREVRRAAANDPRTKQLGGDR